MRFSPRRYSAGFTLLEMMTVVAIIGITAGLAAPAMMSSIANRRAGEATHAVVRIGARARSEALAYSRAHLLTFVPTSTGPDSYGTFELWRGRIDRCAANDWSTLLTGSCATNPDCIDSLDMGTYAHPTNRVRVQLEGSVRGALCFEPSGDMYYANTPPGAGGSIWSSTPPAGRGGVEFSVDRMTNGARTGVTRRVVFPFGATPRIRR